MDIRPPDLCRELDAVTLSVVVIAKNEADNIVACLETVDWADEIVVVDGGSTDATVELAKRYTSKVYVEVDWRGFGVQRQRAQARARGGWLLMIDADERVTPELKAQIEAIVEEDDRSAVYAVPRLSYCFGRYIRHSGWYPDYVSRLYPKGKAVYGSDLVHEKLIPAPGMRTLKLKGDLLHYTYRDLEHYLVKSASYAKAWSEDRHRRGKRASLGQGILHGLACFMKMYVMRRGYLDGPQGLLLAVLSAHSTFAKYADLWIRCRTSGSGS